jgi:hypothetical protein
MTRQGALTGLDAVTFGVADMDAAHRFCLDWGLAEVAADPTGCSSARATAGR